MDGLKRGALLAVALCLALSLTPATVAPPPQPAPEPLPETMLTALRNGDVICRLGDRLWSQFFVDVSATDRRYSHLGIVRVADGRATVIHSEGTATPGMDVVKEESIDDFVQIARTIGVYRAKGLDGGLISKTAAEYIGAPFDWRFDMEDQSKLYCTELLYAVLKRVAPQIELATVYVGVLDKRVIPLEAVSGSEYFDEVLYSRSRRELHGVHRLRREWSEPPATEELR